jgi:hypothetical protein
MRFLSVKAILFAIVRNYLFFSVGELTSKLSSLSWNCICQLFHVELHLQNFLPPSIQEMHPTFVQSTASLSNVNTIQLHSENFLLPHIR